MNLNYSGQEAIAASHDVVWAFINDPASIASCMPDVLESTVIDPHTFDATVQVAVTTRSPMSAEPACVSSRSRYSNVV